MLKQRPTYGVHETAFFFIVKIIKLAQPRSQGLSSYRPPGASSLKLALYRAPLVCDCWVSQLWDRAHLDTSFLTLKKVHPNLKSKKSEIKCHLEIRFNFRSVLLNFQSFTEKPVFECPFAHLMILFLSYLVRNSMDRVSVICKLAMKWYLVRMCTSWLCSFYFYMLK